MSLLLLANSARLREKTSATNADSASNDSAVTTDDFAYAKRSRAWLVTYIALVTSLLAFFILIITLVELEGSTLKRNYQKLVAKLYTEVSYVAKQQGVDWLQMENTLTKGVRLTIPAGLVKNQTLFASARAKINPRYLPYLQSIADILQTFDIESFLERHKKLIQAIESAGYNVQFMVRIEGHTDSQPLAATARFADNVELSTFRAYAMMEWLRIHLGLPRSGFAISGYGSFHPLTDNAIEAKNRRIEIYLIPQVTSRLEAAL